MKEKFKRVYLEGVRSNYKVSTFGRVLNTKTDRYLKPRSHTSGYVQVSLYQDTKEYRFYIHRLVMLTFMNDRDMELNQVNHEDGNKKNNYLYNLSWVNNSLNQIHAHQTGLKDTLRGENAGRSKFKDFEVHHICSLMERGMNNYDIREMYPNANGDFLLSIRKGRNWRHISEAYDIPMVDNRPTGENNKSSIYSDAIVHDICKLILLGWDDKNIREELNIESKDYVRRIRKCKLRRDISSQYGLNVNEEGSTTIEIEFLFSRVE